VYPAASPVLHSMFIHVWHEACSMVIKRLPLE
jgi:hypothetical protein